MALAILATGCAGPRQARDTEGYQTIDAAQTRQTDKARGLNDQALKLLEGDELDQAEAAARHALDADVMFGPAHNTLGIIYLRQNKLYLAAWEFKYATAAMPHHPEPRNNLGLVFERANRYDDAVDHYAHALDLAPDAPQIIGNLARAKRRRGDHGPDVKDLLHQLILKDHRPQWTGWARRELVELGDYGS